MAAECIGPPAALIGEASHLAETPVSSLPTVLIVEDEPNLRMAVVRGLKRSLHANIVGVESVAAARSVLESTPPAVLITDIDLPDGTGLDLFAELDRRGQPIPVAFVSSHVNEWSGRLPHRRSVEIVEKPIPLDRWKTLVLSALAERDGAPRSPFVAADYLQLAEIGHKSVVVGVHTAKGKGEIVVEGGRVVAANAGELDGMVAFRELVFAEGEISCRSLRPEERIEPNVVGSCEELLMEAARLVDEDESGDTKISFDRWSTRPPPPASSVQALGTEPDPVAAPAIEDPYEAGVEALLARRYDAAQAYFMAAKLLRPRDRTIDVNLARLEALLGPR